MEHYILEDSCAFQRGSIEVICGSMFSGKTEELLRRLRRAKIANLTVEIFKPAIDNRYDEVLVISHDKNKIPSTPVESSQSILLMSSGVDVVGIDEAQFFDSELTSVVQQMADNGIRVVIAGLDMDYKRNPFGPMASLCAIADSVDKIHAICMDCGRLANYSFRKTENSSQVMLGEMNEYKPLCRCCYNKYNIINKKLNEKNYENDIP